MSEVLHLSFSPGSVAWIGDLQTKALHSSSAQIRARMQKWAAFGLGELALAIATRLEIMTRTELRLRERLNQLLQELEESGALDSHLDGAFAYRVKEEALLFEICGAVDSCFFEWRSLYELLCRFSKVFGRKILGIQVRDTAILGALETAGTPSRWVEDLKAHREIFFHQTAPWLALQIFNRSPLQCGLVVMQERLHELDDLSKFISEQELVEVSNYLRQAVRAVRDWLSRELKRVENGAGAGAV